MTTSSDSLLFLRWFLMSVVTGIVIAVAVVVAIDPYDQYRVVVKEGFNRVKPELTRYQNEIKLTHAAELRADALILGNSRAEAGLDPEAGAFTQSGLSAYNLAVPGSGILNSRRQAEYLYQIGAKPKTIILGMEFLDFMESGKAAAPAISHTPSIGQVPHPDSWFWRFDSLFSLASLKDAMQTLSIQGDEEADVMTPRGFNPLRGYVPIARREGYFRLFKQRAGENTRIYLRKAKGSLSLDDLVHLNAILDLAAESGTEANLIIYPYHAQILALFEETGLANAFEEWKMALISEVSAARARHPDARITLFDFSGYGPYNCERIPEHGDHVTSTQWYWEAGHFKKQLGDILLKSVFSSPLLTEQTEGQRPPGMFGFQLDDSNSAENLKRISLERARCSQSYPELFAEATALVRLERGRN
ncbi:MAG TPA: hypothetical protein VFI43_04590 [Nitrosospira sp.]|nr:hypothetical protein [Nitrosospira sp.]